MTWSKVASSRVSILAYKQISGEPPYVYTGEISLTVNNQNVLLDEATRRELAAYLLDGLTE